MRTIARSDLTGSGAVTAAVAAMAIVCALDLTDGRLGAAFSVGFILIVVTVPFAVAQRSVVVAGVLPPVLMIVALFAVVLIEPSAVSVSGLADDAGTFSRTLAAVLDHGLTLVVGHGLALAAIVLRNSWAAKARALTPA